MPEYAGMRKVQDMGDSKGVTLPKKELRALGVDMEDLEELDVPCELNDGIYQVDLSDAVN